jgi:hypothetical protein
VWLWVPARASLGQDDDAEWNLQALHRLISGR